MQLDYDCAKWPNTTQLLQVLLEHFEILNMLLRKCILIAPKEGKSVSEFMFPEFL